MRPGEPEQEQPVEDDTVEIRLKGPAGPVLAASTRLKLSVNVLSESENCPNRTGMEVRRYLIIEPVEDSPTRCTIRLMPAGMDRVARDSAEPQLVICGAIPLRQIGDLITALIETAMHLGEEETRENGAGGQGHSSPRSSHENSRT